MSFDWLAEERLEIQPLTIWALPLGGRLDVRFFPCEAGRYSFGNGRRAGSNR